MDDLYAINAAKTEIREAYSKGDVERLMALLAGDLVDYTDGMQSGYGEGARNALRTRLRDLFGKYHVVLVPIIVEIRITGAVAVEYGWHELTLTPKGGGEPIQNRMRYFDVWKKDKTGNWKLSMFIDNADVPDQVNAAPAA